MVELGTADYTAANVVCAAGDRDGAGGIHNDERSDAGIRYSVRTPANYDPAIAHPLLMVYAAAGHGRAASEHFTDLTHAATAAGFIVAYSDHRRLSIKVLDELAKIPHAIARKWCVDVDRIFATGHSDGGTAAAAMAFRDDDGLTPAGVAPSAAGVRTVDLEAYACPQPLRVFVLHNRDDKLFPGFGKDAAAWWARCQQCDESTDLPTIDGCRTYSGCAGAGAVRYCEAGGGHVRWPQKNNLLSTLR